MFFITELIGIVSLKLRKNINYQITELQPQFHGIFVAKTVNR